MHCENLKFDSMFVCYVIVRHSGLMKKKVTVLERDVIVR